MMITQPLKLQKRLKLRRLLLQYQEAMLPSLAEAQPVLQEQFISHQLHLASLEQSSLRLPLVARKVKHLRLEQSRKLQAARRLVVVTSLSTPKLPEQLAEHSTSHLMTQKSQVLSSLRHYLVMLKRPAPNPKAQSLKLPVAESIPQSSAAAQ
jgi:hypothetical protein